MAKKITFQDSSLSTQKTRQVDYTLVVNYLPFAKQRAYEHFVKWRKRFELDDLTSVAIHGLIEASMSFDSLRGFDFSTFARYRVLAALDTYCWKETDWTGTVSRGMYRDAHAVKKVESELYRQLGRHPSIAELARAMNKDEERVSQLMGVFSNRIISLSVVMGDGASTLADYIVSVERNSENAKTTEPPEKTMRRQQIRKALRQMSPPKQKLIKRRFGLGREKAVMSWTELGVELGMTGTGARRKFLRALRELEQIVERNDLSAGRPQ